MAFDFASNAYAFNPKMVFDFAFTTPTRFRANGALQKGEHVVEEFREACGPADPEVARALYPDTLRALLGVQQVSCCCVVDMDLVTISTILCRISPTEAETTCGK